ncbi:MAG TPA: transglycosylase SLT domain-containing protein [Ktedonobacteraceae bacterium]|nr:transglycosylase SLT domain-containing protein [Ktedonobacteraceae bacterium]
MSQFRPLPSFRSNDVPDMTEEPSNPILFASSLMTTTTTTETTTDQLPIPILTTQQLATFTGALPANPTTGRFLRIPGTVKRDPITDKLPRSTRRMSPRLRHGLIFFVVFFVVLTTLLSLSPLDNGQNSIPIIGGISDWVHAQQLTWQLQAQQVTQANPSQSGTAPTPPPINLPVSQYIAIAQQDALNAGISPTYFVRQIDVESGFNPNAYSPAGAEGIAQFEPATAAGLGINPWNPIQALNGAAHLMANYNNNYGGNYAMALAAYNGGSGTVQYAVNACGSSAWMNCLPGETRHYIYEIMGI